MRTIIFGANHLFEVGKTGVVLRGSALSAPLRQNNQPLKRCCCVLASYTCGFIRGLIASVLLLAGITHSTFGQEANGSEPSLCFGFAFGSWTPALDWELAGHGSPVDSARVPRAPNGRGWAAIDVEHQSDSTLLLFPPWWPAGVSVKLTNKFASPRDTISGRAVALVADGRKRPPTSSVRLWQVPCDR